MILEAMIMFGSALAGWVAVESIKVLANARKSGLTEEESHFLRELHDMHNIRDENGRLLWYQPAKLDENVYKTVLLLRDISRLQAEHALILDKLRDEVSHLNRDKR